MTNRGHKKILPPVILTMPATAQAEPRPCRGEIGHLAGDRVMVCDAKDGFAETDKQTACRLASPAEASTT
jgi:hypothetical protein